MDRTPLELAAMDDFDQAMADFKNDPCEANRAAAEAATWAYAAAVQRAMELAAES